VIRDNIDTGEIGGGGVIVLEHSAFMMHNGEISGNSTRTNGGGVFVASNSVLHIQSGAISNNRALNGHGGGIYTEDANYPTITTTANVMFSGNSASELQEFLGFASDFPNIAWGSLSISIGRTPHALNDYDINYVSPEAFISLMRAPNDLLFHQVGSQVVTISNNLSNLVTTVRGWFCPTGIYTCDIVVKDTTSGGFNWSLSLTNTQELTYGPLVLEDTLV